VVKVENLWKTFKIPHEKRTTLFETLTGFFQPSEYETFTVLKEINFAVENGECVGIIGENGSGKSTLLKVIANILRPTRGRVDIQGRVTPFLELGVGFQPDLTARENIGVYATIMGLSNGEIRNKIDDIIDFADLRKFEDAKLKNLSSGMQVRLAFSTAIQTDPDVMLVDEVLAVGDMEFQQKCFDVFNRYRKEGVTILFVSHDLGAVRRFCDKTLLLRHGEQMAFGDTGEIIDRYVYGGVGRERPEEGAKNEENSETSGEAKSENAPESEAEAKPRRWGNHKIMIKRVMFLDKFGFENSRFNSFDPMKVRIYYKAHESVADPVFGIGLYTAEGRHVYGTNTALKDLQFDHLEGEGYIDLEIERIPMLAGKFLLSLAIQNRDYSITYDWIDKQYSFEVISTGRDDGLFEVPCKWIVSNFN